MRKPGEEPRPTPRPRSAEPGQPGETSESPQHDQQAERHESGTEQQALPAEPEGADSAETAADVSTPDESDARESQAVPESAPAETPEVVSGTAAPKPGPRRKQRSEASGKPGAEHDVVGAAAPGTPPARLAGARARKPRKRLSRKASYILAGCLLVLAAVFATGAVFAKIGYSNISETTDNAALINVNKTQQVKKAMSSAAERLFSYDYRHIGKTKKAAKQLLANSQVQHKYDMLMDEVKRLAPKQQIVVKVTATESAVVNLDDDHAKVMVYVDQTSTRTKSKKSSAGGAALWFTTELRDGKWKVVDMDTYSSGKPVSAKQGGGKQGGKPQQGKQQGSGNKPPPSKQSGN